MTPDDPLHAEGQDAAGVVPPGARRPRWLLAAGGAAALAAAVVTILGWAIDRGAQFAFDRGLLLWLRGGAAHGAPIGPWWIEQAMLDLTAAGSVTILLLIVVLVAGFLALRRLWLTVALVLGGTITGSIAVATAKALVGRARPAVTDHLVQVHDASFPSGHSANSAIVYLTLATVLAQIVAGRAARRYILGCAVLLVAAIGVSRVYLGVHWPSDVLAGWAFGTLWAIAWWAIGAWARARRASAALRE